MPLFQWSSKKIGLKWRTGLCWSRWPFCGIFQMSVASWAIAESKLSYTVNVKCGQEAILVDLQKSHQWEVCPLTFSLGLANVGDNCFLNVLREISPFPRQITILCSLKSKPLLGRSVIEKSTFRGKIIMVRNKLNISWSYKVEILSVRSFFSLYTLD